MKFNIFPLRFCFCACVYDLPWVIFYQHFLRTYRIDFYDVYGWENHFPKKNFFFGQGVDRPTGPFIPNFGPFWAARRGVKDLTQNYFFFVNHLYLVYIYIIFNAASCKIINHPLKIQPKITKIAFFSGNFMFLRISDSFLKPTLKHL